MRGAGRPGASVEAAAGGVVPTLAELVALRGAAQAPRPPRRGRHGISGPAPATMRGRGMEYAESRDYALGDDARHIDWRVTARSGRLHTKLFQAERERLTLVVADTAEALYFGTRVRFKSVQAARAGAVGAWAAIRDGDRVGALRGSHVEPLSAPAGGPRGALRVLDALVRWYAARPADDAGLATALERARRLLRPGSRVLVLADAGSIGMVPEEAWPALSIHHDVVVVLVEDPLERQPPSQRLPLLSEGRRIEPDLADAALRGRWLDTFDGESQRVVERLRARGVRAERLSTEAPSQSWLPLPGSRTQAA